MGGIKCAIGVAPVRKHSVMSETAIAMAAGSYSLRDLRDRALALLSFASAMRCARAA
jgi:hypothetical protein